VTKVYSSNGCQSLTTFGGRCLKLPAFKPPVTRDQQKGFMSFRGNLYFPGPLDDEDKATLTRRKNAEAQRQYRERKKEQEQLLLAESELIKPDS